MKRTLSILTLLCCTPVATWGADDVAKQTKKQPVKVGALAPDFEMKGSDGKVYKLSDFRGKRGVVVAWYPRAFTGG